MSKSTFLRQIAAAIAIVTVVSMSAYAQRGPGGGGRGGAPGGRGGFGGFGGGGSAIFTLMQQMGNTPANFAMRDDVQKELDLTEDQVAELRDVVPDRRAMMQDLGIDFRSLGDMSEDDRAELEKDVQKKVAKKHDEVMEDVADILSTKQTGRLKELRFQYTALTQRNPAQALRAADIKVDEDDEKKIKEALADVDKELAAKIAKLRRTAYMEAMASVVNESKLDSLMGESFVFESSGFGGGAFGRGGRGGPGQARGGGNRGESPRREGGNRPRRPSGDDEDANPRRRRGN